MDLYDMIVVGAGPSGSMAALTAAKKGLKVLMVERDPIPGTPVRCAEGVDEKGLSEYFTPDPAWISAVITNFNLIAPDGRRVHINTNPEKGFILDRTKFDLMIAEKAEEAGAVLMTGVEATGIGEYANGRRKVTLRSVQRDFEVVAPMIIAADGVESKIGKMAGLKTATSPRHMESCSQVVLEDVDIDPSGFDLYFTNEFAPGGYAWMFPKGKRMANVGLGISGFHGTHKTAEQYLDSFTARYFPGGKIVTRTRGGVSCSGGIDEITSDGLILCGDSAHMANPITGGGIVNALIAGKAAAETASEAIEKGSTETKYLRPYVKLCRKRIIVTNKCLFSLKRALFSFSDDDLNQIADRVLRIPGAKRTPKRILMVALWKFPSLLPALARAAI